MIWVLLISLASLALGIYNAVHGVRIDRARIRTDVMTLLYGVQIGYEQFLRRIRELKNWPPKPLPDELEWLIASEQAYVGFLNNTAQYRQTLLGPKRVSRTDLYKLKHHVDAMAQRIEADNKRLDELLAKYPTGRELRRSPKRAPPSWKPSLFRTCESIQIGATLMVW